jgi:hypothetical protein
MIAEKRLTPKQKRTIREKINKEKQSIKSARLLKLPEYNCTPRIQETIQDIDKLPRSTANPDSIMTKLMEWCPLRADRIGGWSWGQQRQWNDQEWDGEIHPKLLEFQKLTWAEIFAQRTGSKKKRHKLHHDMEVFKLIPEACDRWSEIGLEEYDTAFRFRLGGERRLWGYKILATFKLIWWDPQHKIYPTDV